MIITFLDPRDVGVSRNWGLAFAFPRCRDTG